MISPLRLLPLLCLAAGPALAQSAPKIDCAKATATPELNFCEEQAFDRADRQLNDAWRTTLARIDKSDMEAPKKAEWRRAAQDAQRKWIAFRDADCGGAVAFEWFGGTGATGAVLGCKREKTLARVKDLRERGTN